MARKEKPYLWWTGVVQTVLRNRANGIANICLAVQEKHGTYNQVLAEPKPVKPKKRAASLRGEGFCIASGRLLLPHSTRSLKSNAISDFAADTHTEWDELQAQGYRCVPVQIRELPRKRQMPIHPDRESA